MVEEVYKPANLAGLLTEMALYAFNEAMRTLLNPSVPISKLVTICMHEVWRLKARAVSLPLFTRAFHDFRHRTVTTLLGFAPNNPS